MTDLDGPRFLDIIRVNDANVQLLDRLGPLHLPQCHLTAGCLFQTLWNVQSDRPPAENIKDYVIFYFDGSDLSWEAEDDVIRRVAQATADLGLPIEVKNQARVHLWYRQRFGADYPPLFSAQDGISRYLVACTCVGIDVETCEVFAPDGYGDLAKGVLRINPVFPQPAQFLVKARRYQSRWPWLSVVTQ